jgi:CBS-domain-containing membrane protein
MAVDTEPGAAPAESTARWPGRIRAHLRANAAAALVSGLGGGAAIWLLASAGQILHLALLIAPFGATCVLLFALPAAPVAQPRNVIGGHLLSSMVGLSVLALTGPGPLACALGVGGAIAAMQITKTLHPPAGADPLVIIAAGASWPFLAIPLLPGAAALVLLAFLYHRLISGRAYPVRAP